MIVNRIKKARKGTWKLSPSPVIKEIQTKTPFFKYFLTPSSYSTFGYIHKRTESRATNIYTSVFTGALFTLARGGGSSSVHQWVSR